MFSRKYDGASRPSKNSDLLSTLAPFTVEDGPTCPLPSDPLVMRALDRAADLYLCAGEACITLKSEVGMDTLVVRSAPFASHIAKSWHWATDERPSDRAIKAAQNAIAEIAEKIGDP